MPTGINPHITPPVPPDRTPAAVLEHRRLMADHAARQLAHERTAQEIEAREAMQAAIERLTVRRQERVDTERRSRPERRRKA